MKDFTGTDIEVGDELLVIKPIEGFISDDKTYIAQGFREDEGRVIVTDDRNLEGHYLSTRFTVNMACRMFRTQEADSSAQQTTSDPSEI